MSPGQTHQITVEQAISEAAADANELCALATKHRSEHTAIDTPQSIRHWQPSAGTYCYQTHIAIAEQPVERLAWLTEVLFNASSLLQQPWYPQFIGGKSEPLSSATNPGIQRHMLAWGRFDLGLANPRYYRQLLSLAKPVEHSSVIVARSINTGPALPADARLAYTLSPNGEVLHLENDVLHWHHICCTPGAAILPGRLDRWLINSLRGLGLDRAERRTYYDEAVRLRDWLQSDIQASDVAGIEAALSR